MAPRPKLLICTPEIVLGLPEGIGNLSGRIINFMTGGMAPVNSAYVKAFADDGDIESHAVVPKWESSLRELSDLTEREIRRMQGALGERLHLIQDTSFNRVRICGSNTLMYDDTARFSPLKRALAFSNGIVNYVIPHVQPDIVWLSDWMVGLVAPVARAQGIKVLTTGHNIFTGRAAFDHIVDRGIEIRNGPDYRPEDHLYWSQGRVDMFATGIFAADYFTTVSEGFLQRIAAGAFDQDGSKPQCVLEEIKNKVHSGNAKGVPNPLEDEHSDFLYELERYGGEATARLRSDKRLQLCEEVGLRPGPRVVVYPNRLFSAQKNPELLFENAIRLAHETDSRILILANGQEDLIQRAHNVARESDGYVAYRPFRQAIEDLAKGGDNVYGLMTPHYEPCGGPNINYPFEGVLVMGHRIDGLEDTCIAFSADHTAGNGFPFSNNDRGGLDYAFTQMQRFSELEPVVRYGILERVARETYQAHRAATKKDIMKDIMMNLL